jgi:isopenicillin-N N-acyltransferase-like protein
VNGIYYLELRGTPAEMGRRHGALLKKQIHEQVADYRKNVLATFGKENGERLLKYVVSESRFVKDIRKHFPHVYAEMEGVAEGAGLKLADILLLQMYEEVYEGAAQHLKVTPLKPGQGKCTTLACAGRKGLPNLNAQNLDYTPNLDGAQLMVHYTYPSGLKILMYTFAGQVGGIGLNSEGLSMLCNTLPEGSKRQSDGLGGTYITRGLLERGSAEDAVAWLRRMPQYGCYNYSLADFRGARMAEYSPKGLAVREVPRDTQFLAHTNHLHWLDDRHEIPGFPGGRPDQDASTAVRQAAADRQLAGKGVTATVADLKALLTAAPVNRQAKDWMTLQSLIVVHDRGDLRAYASAGSDPGRAWNVYRLK